VDDPNAELTRSPDYLDGPIQHSTFNLFSHHGVTVARRIRERILEIDENERGFARMRCVASGGRFWACAAVATHSDVASNIITKARLARQIFASLGMCGVLDVGKGMGAARRYGLSTMD